MKRIFISLLLLPLLVLSSCEQEPMLTVSGDTFSFKEDGGVATLSITTNNPWRASSSQSWCKLSMTSGEVTELSSASISIMCEANQSYEPRSCTITISSAELQEVITVEQTDNKGILVTPTKVEMTNAASTFELDVRHNVEFSVTSNVSWIKQVSSKSLTDSKLYFSVEANTSYDNREGTITLTQKNGTMKQEVKVYQSQENAIIISSKKYDITSTMQTVEVAIKSNVKYEVSIPDDAKPWVSYIGTKALAEAIVLLEVKGNETYDARSATITIKDQNSSLKDEIVINQAARDGLILSEKEFNLESSGGNISVVVSSNVDYTITPSERWISVVTTKGLTDNTHTLNVQKNEGFSDRSAFVVFKAKNVPALADTVFVNQRRNEYLKLEQTTYEMYPEGGTIDVAVKTNVDYVIAVPEDAKNWLSVESHGEEGFQLLVGENESKARETKLSLTWTKESIEQVTVVNIRQQEFSPTKVTLSHAGELPELIPVERKDKIRKLIIEGNINGTDVLFFRSMKKLTHINLRDANVVEGGEAFIKYGETFSVLQPNGSYVGLWATSDCYTKDGNIESMFMGMGNLLEIILPKNLKSLGYYNTFYGCSGLTSITIPKSVQDDAWGRGRIFNSTLNMEAYYVEEGCSTFMAEDGCLYDINGCYLVAVPCTYTKYTVTDKVMDFCWNSFAQGNRLEVIDLRDFSYDFRRSSNLEELSCLKQIIVSETNPRYKSESGVLLEKDGSILYVYPNQITNENYKTPEGVKILAYYSFAGNPHLKRVEVSEGVTTIKTCAFSACSKLEYLSLPSTLLKVEDAVLQHCPALRTLVSHAVTPPVLYDSYVWYEAKFSEILVPSESVEAYKTADVWKEFADKIKAIE